MVRLSLVVVLAVCGCSNDVHLSTVSITALEAPLSTTVDVKEGETISFWHDMDVSTDEKQATTLRYHIDTSIDGEPLESKLCDPWRSSNNCRQRTRNFSKATGQVWKHCWLTRCDLNVPRTGKLEVKAKLTGHPSTRLDRVLLHVKRD